MYIKLLGLLFIFEKTKQKNNEITRKKTQNIPKEKVNCAKKIGERCFAPISRSPRKSPCFVPWMTVQRVTLNCPFLR